MFNLYYLTFLRVLKAIIICLVNLSLGSAHPYPETTDSIAIQRVVERGGKAFSFHDTLGDKFFAVYVVAAAGNEGAGGLQTINTPSISPSAMAVASVDNMYDLLYYTIIAPDGSTILYQAGTNFGGWKSTINSVIVVNSQFTLHYYT